MDEMGEFAGVWRFFDTTVGSVNVMGFVALNKERNIQVEFLGDKNHRMQLGKADKEAAAGIYSLAEVLSTLTRLNKEREEAKQKIAFIEGKMKERAHQATSGM